MEWTGTPTQPDRKNGPMNTEHQRDCGAHAATVRCSPRGSNPMKLRPSEKVHGIASPALGTFPFTPNCSSFDRRALFVRIDEFQINARHPSIPKSALIIARARPWPNRAAKRFEAMTEPRTPIASP